MGLFPLILRPAKQGDVPRLIEVGIAASLNFADGLPGFENAAETLPHAVTRWVGHGAHILVAEGADDVVGWVKANPENGEVEDLWVHPDNHRQGIGAILLAAGEAYLKGAGYAYARLDTHALKTSTLKFYRTHGYTLIDIDQHASTQSVPALTYPKAILGKVLSRPRADAAETMTDVRTGIDTLDPTLVSLVAERFTFIDRAAELKPALTMPARVASRVEEVVSNARASAQAIGFDPDLTETLWRTMIDLAIAREEATMGPDEPLAKVAGNP